jgi:hypothetical protein
VPQAPEGSNRTSPGAFTLKLNAWYRTTAIVLGLAGLGSGAVAVFVTHLEAGPVALLVVGVLLLLIGMGGHMPNRLKIGDHEAAWEIEREAVEVFVERVAEDATIESRPEVLEALEELAERAPRIAAIGVSSSAYESFVRHTIMEAFKDEEASGEAHYPVKLLTNVTGDHEFDGILEGPTGRLVGIEIKSSKLISENSIKRMHRKLREESHAWRGPGVMLLITQNPLTLSAQRALASYPEIRHVVFAGPQDREELIRAVREITAE